MKYSFIFLKNADKKKKMLIGQPVKNCIFIFIDKLYYLLYMFHGKTFISEH